MDFIKYIATKTHRETNYMGNNYRCEITGRFIPWEDMRDHYNNIKTNKLLPNENR